MNLEIVKNKVKQFCDKYKFKHVINKFRFVKNVNSDFFISINVLELNTKIKIECYKYTKYDIIVDIDNHRILNEDYEIIEIEFKNHILNILERIYRKELFNEDIILANKN